MQMLPLLCWMRDNFTKIFTCYFVKKKNCRFKLVKTHDKVFYLLQLKEKEEHKKQLEEERQNHTLTVQRHGEELERQSRELERQREELERQGRELKMKDGKLNRMKTLTIVYEKFRQWIEDEASNSNSGFTEFNHSEVDDSIPKDQKYHLGKGSYGIVYKAELRGKTVAMKILDKSSWQGERKFKQEVSSPRKGQILCELVFYHYYFVNWKWEGV